MLNPILIKDLRILMRDRLTYLFSLFYVIAIGCIIFGMLIFVSTSKKALSQNYGQNILFAFLVFLTLLICSISSGLGAKILFSDLQKCSYIVLKITLLKPSQIISGKALAVIIYIIMLMLLSLPLLFIIMPIGGASYIDIAKCYLVVFISSATFCMIGLMWSSLFTSLKTSIALTYIITGVIILGTILIPLILTKIFNIKIPQTILGIINIISPFISIIDTIQGQHLIFTFPAWSITIFIYLIISIIAFIISFIRLRIILD